MTAETMGALAKVRYTHEDMIDFLIAHPECAQKDLALRYGYTQAWISNIMASDAWKVAYETRRALIVDPGLVLTVEERLRALVLRSQEVLMAKLEQPQVSDQTALKALELGLKGTGIGQPKTQEPPADLSRLAERLQALIPNRTERIIDAEIIPQGS